MQFYLKVAFWISVVAHFALFTLGFVGGQFDWLSTTPPAPQPLMIPVEFLPIAKTSQGEVIVPPAPVVKQAEKEEEKKDPKAEETPPEAPKPIPQKEKEEPKKEEPKPKPDPAPAPSPEAVPVKKKTEVPPKKKPETKPVPKKEPPKKDAPKKEAPKKAQKIEEGDDFEQILKNLDTTPPPAKKAQEKAEKQGKKKNVSQKLSDEAKMSLIDAMMRQVQKCWTIDPGIKDASNMTAVLHIKLKIDGSVESVENLNQSRVNRDVFYRSFVEGAQRAVYECGPYNLPPDMYNQEEGWREMEITFDPRSMLNN